MSPPITSKREKPRELRRRVMLGARMRTSAGWSDANILNVSSRGLMINATAASALGGKVEIWHGDHLIVAEVVWRKGSRAGLRCEDRVPVEDILAVTAGASLQLTAAKWPQVERRKRPRSEDADRLRGRAFEFAGVVLIAVALGFCTLTFMQQAFAAPMHAVSVALGG